MKRKSQITRAWWRYGEPKFPYNVPGISRGDVDCPDCGGSGWIKNRTRADKRKWAVQRELNNYHRVGMSHRKCDNDIHTKWVP